MPHSGDPLLLLSGAGLPDWIWADVRGELAPGLEAAVARRPDPVSHARLRDYAEAAVTSAPSGRFVVVAHSAGSVVAAEILRLAPDRVSGLLAVTGVVPPSGGSFLSAMPVPSRWFLGLALRVSGTRPPAQAIRRGVAHGLDEEAASRVVADFAPESPGLYRDRVATSRWDGLPGYVLTTGDRELPVALQRRFAERLGAQWREDLPTGHLPMLESPEALARSIERNLDWVAQSPPSDRGGGSAPDPGPTTSGG